MGKEGPGGIRREDSSGPAGEGGRSQVSSSPILLQIQLGTQWSGLERVGSCRTSEDRSSAIAQLAAL